MSVVTVRPALLSRTPLLIAAIAVVAVAIVAAAGAYLRAPALLPAASPSTGNVIAQLERRAIVDDGRMDLSAILATPEYFRYTGQTAMGERYAAERNVVVIFAEDVHYGELAAAPRPELLLDGRAYAPASAQTLVDVTHHRVTALVYSEPELALVDPSVMTAELSVEGVAGDLRWERPFGTARGGAPVLSLPLILALFGGMLASMWPCLLQLTAYFIPSVAGLSIEEARSGVVRTSVVRTALLFVSGIVIVYTLAGFVAGLAAQSFAATNLLETARRPLTLVAGLVIVGMAVRLALRARQPMVCHMPTSAPSRRSAAGTVLLGLAFATGCMTCFGAVIVLGMFTYIFTTASPLVGAALLFVFSLGIAVPLVIAAVAMARVLPLLARVERLAPALSFASAGIMAAYGALLLTDSSHVISDGIARLASWVQ